MARNRKMKLGMFGAVLIALGAIVSSGAVQAQSGVGEVRVIEHGITDNMGTLCHDACQFLPECCD